MKPITKDYKFISVLFREIITLLRNYYSVLLVHWALYQENLNIHS